MSAILIKRFHRLFFYKLAALRDICQIELLTMEETKMRSRLHGIHIGVRIDSNIFLSDYYWGFFYFKEATIMDT